MLKQKTPLQRKTPMVRGSGFARKPVNEQKPAAGPKPRKCGVKACRAPFLPSAPHVDWCGPECAVIIALERVAKQKAKAAKAERIADKKKLEGFKPLEYWLKKAEAACNQYIRLRDPDICISCGVTHSSAWQAGHYVSVGANRTLRYHEDNIHKQCIHCNMHKASNATEYRIRLIDKIGIERVEWLESWHSPLKMTREAAQEIEAHYKAKIKVIKGSA